MITALVVFRLALILAISIFAGIKLREVYDRGRIDLAVVILALWVAAIAFLTFLTLLGQHIAAMPLTETVLV